MTGKTAWVLGFSCKKTLGYILVSTEPTSGFVPGHLEELEMDVHSWLYPNKYPLYHRPHWLNHYSFIFLMYIYIYACI